MSNTRDRAWRRFKKHVKAQQPILQTRDFHIEKNWKLMYQRPKKRYRAKQLGFEYPIRSIRQQLDQELPLS